MNTVGRILIVVMTVLTLCFMTFAGAVYTVQTSWRVKSNSLQEQFDAQQKRLTDMNAEYQDYKNDSTSQVQEMTQRAETAEANNVNLQQTNDALKGERDRARAERNEAVDEAEIATEEAAARLAEADALRQEDSRLRETIGHQIETVRDQEDQVFALERDARVIREKYAGLLDRAARAERLLRQNEIDLDTEIVGDERDPPPAVEGRVLGARRNRTGSVSFVEVSIGTDDGLQKGHQLMVYRGSRFLADIRLIDVNPDGAVGIVIEKTRNGVIERGDYVTSRL